MKFKSIFSGVIIFYSCAIFANPANTKLPTITIKLQTAYPRTMRHLGTLPYQLSALVKEISDGKINIKVYQPGEIVDTLNLEAAVGAGKLDAAFSGMGYVAHEKPAVELFTAIPFGPPPLIYAGWMYYGGGLKLLTTYIAEQNIVPIPAVLLPTEASGWFKKEIKKPEDLQGLKIRAYGLARPVLRQLGVKTIMLPGHKLYAAFKKGQIDGAEFSSPSIDLSLQLYKVSNYYYFPGWHQPATFLFIYFNKKVWQTMPKRYKTIIFTASKELVFDNYLRLETAQLKALTKLRTKTNIRRWSPKMLRAFYTAWQQIITKYSQQDPNFKKIWQSMQNYHYEFNYWRNLNTLPQLAPTQY